MWSSHRLFRDGFLKKEKKMKNARVIGMAVCVFLTMYSMVQAETHSELQAVDATGQVTYSKIGATPVPANLVVLEGIVLNNPEDMLDPAYQWQIFLQGEGSDTSGTSIWAGKFYQSSVWADELVRLNASGFRQGDRIRITGYAASMNGKANINERHSAAPEMDFSVTLLQSGVGLPTPELTTVAEINDFDATRQTGGERYQNRRIRLEHVSLQSGTTAWGSNSYVTIVDPSDSNETVPLRLCNVDFGTQLPATWFNIVGLGNQEPITPGPVPGTGLTDGYEVWVTQACGIEVPGDCNLDGTIDGADLAIMATNWNGTGVDWAFGDFTGEGDVDGADLALMATNWNYGPDGGTGMGFDEALVMYGLPEPCTLTILSAGVLVLVRRRTGR
jgi:hypothetical protein